MKEMKTLNDFLERFREIQKKYILSDEGEIVDCFCGCGERIFVSPIPLPSSLSKETTCSVCLNQIKEGEHEIRMVYKMRVIANYHHSCQPERIKELFPLPN